MVPSGEGSKIDPDYSAGHRMVADKRLAEAHELREMIYP
jgi:hypothetical protein